MPEPKRDIKDSVFTFLFSDIEYTKQLYLSLHPEDTDIRDEDFRLVTLENILAIGQYNDLGFQVRDKLILLVEAQSTFSPNIPLRMLMYLAKTYNEYIEEHQLSLYREKKVSIPRPELYVIYTGEKETPDILRLSDMYEGSGSADLAVRVLRDGQPGDILSQYVDFCQVANEQVSLYGRTDEALMSTIQICQERGILVPFLDCRKKEVVDIMTRLFSQEKAWEMELAAHAREEMLANASILDVSRITGISQEEITRIIGG